MLKVLLCIGVTLSPVYFFPSGLPQVSDFVLALFAGLILFGVLWKRAPLIGIGILWPFVALVVWLFAVQIAWLSFVPTVSLLHPLYYFFNLMVITALLQLLCADQSASKWLLFSVRLALIVSAFGVVLQMVAPGLVGSEETPGRLTGFMNNPNQLAYFSLCGLSAMFILQRFTINFHPLSVLAFLSGSLGAIVPMSLAGWGGLALLIAALLVANWRDFGKILRVALALPLAFVSLLYIDAVKEGAFLEGIESRVARIERKIDDVEGERNYDRILAFPQYWLFGAGEGENYRFGEFSGGEIHSSLGNMFFSYGAIGLGLLLLTFWRGLRNAPAAAWLTFGALNFYALTHMGLRSTTFWLVIALLWFQYGWVDRARMASFPTSQVTRFSTTP